MRVLAVSDEIVDSLWRPAVRQITPDLLVSCGDLPFEYLDYLVSMLNVPLVFVPGNHDDDLAGSDGSQTAGGTNADREVVDVVGTRVIGLGGCLRYRPGPNQYTQGELRRRARRVTRRAGRRVRRDGQPVDLLLTHAPPAGVGDGSDPPHHGFTALHDVVDRLQPRYLLHGHIHPYGAPAPDRMMGRTRVCNVVGHRVIDFDRHEG